MTLQVGTHAHQGGLPKLSGRSLWAYRIIWVALAAATLATIGFALFQATAQPVVLGLRMLKAMIVGAVAAVLFWRRQRDPVAAVLSLSFLCWMITSTFDFTTSSVLPMLLDRLRFLLFAVALLLFPDGNWAPSWTRGVALGSCIVFALGVLEAVGLATTSLFLPLAILCVLAAISGLIQRFRITDEETQRQQLKWVALGLVTGVGLILIARAAATLSGPSIASEATFQIGIVAVALGFLVPLLRYRLYDAEAVISRSAAYAVLTVALVGIFAGSEALIESLGQRYLQSGIGQVSGAIAASVAAVLLTPLHARVVGWAELRFQRDLVVLRTELPELLMDVPEHWTPSQVGQAALPKIVDAVQATQAAIVLNDDLIAVEGSSPDPIDLSSSRFPLQLAMRCPFRGLQGWLLLGPRPDGSGYGRDGVSALESIIPALRRALLAAHSRELALERDRAEWRRQWERIEAISAKITAMEPARP